MPGGLATLGMQAASTAMGPLLGLALEGHNDRRQLKQQGKLQELQIAGQKEMGEFNLQQQMKLWEQTNYKAQMEQLRKAGLNPALLYGMSGGGGTTASANTGNVNGANAPSGGGETIAAGGMGMQLGMILAQQKLIEAQTRQVEAETAKTSGVDTTEAESRIRQIAQTIKNAQAQKSVLDVEARLKAIEEMEAGLSHQDRMDFIRYNTGKALEDYGRAITET